MDLTAEDDDLLSYFLSADVAAEQPLNALPIRVIESSQDVDTDEQFSHGQTILLAPERPFGSDGTSSSASFQPTQSRSFMESSMMRPLINDDDTSSSNGALDTDEKRQRRLARNRESARQSRRRKKQYLELLEEKVFTVCIVCYLILCVDIEKWKIRERR